MSDNFQAVQFQAQLAERLRSTTLLVPIYRHDLFRFLQHGGIGAEVGVATGGFAKTIFDVSAPSRMHLIDLWETQSLKDYPEDGFNQTSEFHNKKFESTVRLFDPELASGRVLIHRGHSVERASDFTDEYFDWVHIDANHTYNGAYQDLVAYLPKLKQTGLLFCHDFTNSEFAQKCEFGVVAAVRDVCNKYGCQPIAVTTKDEFPTVVLTKSPGTDVVIQFLANLIFRVDGIVEARDFLKREYQHIQFTFSLERTSFILCV